MMKEVKDYQWTEKERELIYNLIVNVLMQEKCEGKKLSYIQGALQMNNAKVGSVMSIKKAA